MRLLTLLRGELCKLFRRRGTYVGYVLVLMMVGLLATAARHRARSLEYGVGRDFVVSGSPVSAVFFTRMVMEPNFAMLVPMVVAMIAGTMVAGESSTGTLRAALVRPVSRGAVLTAKFVASWLYGLTVAAFIGASAAGFGYVLFGGGELYWMSWGPFLSLPEADAWVRVGLAYALAAGAMLSIASIALLVSTLTEAPWIALTVTMGVIIMCPLLSTIDALDFAEPYLLTQNLLMFGLLFEDPEVVDWAALGPRALCLAGYTVVPLAAAYIIFGRRDVLS